MHDPIATTNNTRRAGSTIYEIIFRVSMWWRIFYGFIRIILGGVLLRLVGTPISEIFYQLTRHEVIEDSHDILLRIVSPLLHHMPLTVTYFIAFYLIFWGVVDIFLSINLLKHNIWAYPISLATISIFIFYELYRVSHTHSLILAIVIIIDIVILMIIKGEYKKLSRNASALEPQTSAEAKRTDTATLLN